MLISKSLVDSLNGFNESFNFYYEDVELCLRARIKILNVYLFMIVL